MFRSSVPYESESLRHWLLLGLIVLLGAVLRFWGLGNIGLHGDEETMGLAVKGVLENGLPVLPSGMTYGRAFLHTYLMAGSAEMFGLSEWALRFPSSVIGTLMIVASFFWGRRFLTPAWSLLFALIIALLPAMISVSQTARMYVIYVTLIIIFSAMIFRWERRESMLDYMLAIVIFVVAVQFQRLSIFSSLLFLMPGLLKKSLRMFVAGSIGVLICVGAFNIESSWVNSLYISTVDFSTNSKNGDSASLFKFLAMSNVILVLTGIFVALATVICILAMKRLSTQSGLIKKTGSIVGWVLAIVGAAVMHYHLAALFFAFGTVLYLRCDGQIRWPVILAGIVLLLAVSQFVDLWHSHQLGGAKDIVMTMIGTPSPWPYLRFSAFFPIAVAAYAAIFFYFVTRYVRSQPLPDHVLLMIIGVWAPIFLIGFFEGHIPLRYVIGFVPFFVLSFLAGLREVYNRHARFPNRSRLAWIASVLLLLAFIRPVELWHNVNAQYSDFPGLDGYRGADHKGAAEFIQSLELDEADIVIAEDVLQQTYYLHRVDYWLRSFKRYTYLKDNTYVDIYTGTPHIGNAAMLEDVLGQEDRGAIYIIGSAETSRNPDYFLGEEMLELLKRTNYESVYEGRDGVTKVLKIPAPTGG